jgi:uncharacterized protein (TIGR03435 family)
VYRHLTPAFAALIINSIYADGIFAQSPATRPTFDAFEVAAIKPAANDRQGRFITMQGAHRFTAANHTLKTIVAAAYNLNPRVISGGPAWIDSDHYDIVAATPGEVRPSLDDQMSMLRKLLADRFRLTSHREWKEMPIYTLTLANGGAKLKEGTDPPDGRVPLIFILFPERVRLPGRNATMGELASVLQRAALDRPVVDKTGLSGRYDFVLEWMPDETQFGGQGPEGTAESAKPDLFAAIQQQLGLRLEAKRGPVETFLIDRVERPTEN